MGLSKKERQEKREAKLATRRTDKRSERNAIRSAVSSYLEGSADAVELPESANKEKVKLAKTTHGTESGPSEVTDRDTPSRRASPLPLHLVGPCQYEIPANARPFMRVPAVVITDQSTIDAVGNDPALEQLANMAALPGIVGRALAMPDFHWGYGFPVGGVAATRMGDGVVSPGGIGFDINCGVRLLRSNLTEAELERRKDKIASALFAAIPSGVGGHAGLPIDRHDRDRLLTHGVAWAIEQGYGTSDDLRYIESNGQLEGADPDAMSKRAFERGLGQLGTLGSGNHFLEVQVVDEIYDSAAAEAMGLAVGIVCVMVHSGSRGLGHQVCQDNLDIMGDVMTRYEITLPDRQLACAPISSPEGVRYLGAMRAAANFAFCNRQGLTYRTRLAFADVFGDVQLDLIYDVSHNVAKSERYLIDGQMEDVLVHRKGATRAFAAGHSDVPAAYRGVGQPVLIPGDMGRYSFVAVGTELAQSVSFGSICHGAGRRLSRSAAKREMRGTDVAADLARRGILVRTPSVGGLAEEASAAYKDVADVLDVCECAGLARKVARLRPRVVIKG